MINLNFKAFLLTLSTSVVLSDKFLLSTAFSFSPPSTISFTTFYPAAIFILVTFVLTLKTIPFCSWVVVPIFVLFIISPMTALLFTCIRNCLKYKQSWNLRIIHNFYGLNEQYHLEFNYSIIASIWKYHFCRLPLRVSLQASPCCWSNHYNWKVLEHNTGRVDLMIRTLKYFFCIVQFSGDYLICCICSSYFSLKWWISR